MPKNPIFSIYIRMFFYGVVYGSLTSGLLFMALQLADTPNWSSAYWLSTFLFGLPCGAFFGGLAGVFSGFAIMLMIEVFLPRPFTVKNIRRYRLSTGIATAGVCGVILLLPFAGLSSISSEANNDIIVLFFIISIGIAIYASQRTLTKYLREIDPRKSKVKYEHEKAKQ